MGVPVSYPARPVNGFILTDLLTPSGVNYAFPPELKDEIESKIGPYPVMPGALARPLRRAFLA
jgi:predicted AlkP superfamily phosphohydrolase/phosphomutase